MAGTFGNKNAKGKKVGRKSAYQELADATNAHQMFFDVQDQAEIERRIESGKFSLRDRFILTGMEGDTAILTKALHKAVPDKVDHNVDGKLIVELSKTIADKHDVTPPDTGPSSE